ncbi:uncharacterized protein BDR25DRAFT_311225 [Lindgomyces ingoldianus]|uniref:Uncharacterized protein n=1 Tax=Lindgomyces ingoldianus TaxID=673940 RepID=A0ACB6R7M0_9PLEO|nr:uncharacterized protein BDR25DRAFT_311225 [Lindgomyces ingoldianus]KAF2474803.1 hypothetical protein BDR25DRAFT_311225 [Lindgomyces ingoldianus]
MPVPFSLLPILICILTLLPPTTVIAQPFSRSLPINTTLKSLVYSGSGCSPGTVSSSLTSSALTLSFDNMYAQIGPGVPVSQNRKNCQINVEIVTDALWRFVVGWDASGAGEREMGTRIMGNMMLEEGVNATFSAGYEMLAGVEAGKSSSNTTFHGPLSGAFDQKLLALDGGEDGVVSKCGGGILRVTDQLRLMAPRNASVSGSLGPQEGSAKFVQETRLAWRAC